MAKKPAAGSAKKKSAKTKPAGPGKEFKAEVDGFLAAIDDAEKRGELMVSVSIKWIRNVIKLLARPGRDFS